MGRKKPVLDANMMCSVNLNKHCVCDEEDAKIFMFHDGNFLLTMGCSVPAQGMFLLGLNPEAFRRTRCPPFRWSWMKESCVLFFFFKYTYRLWAVNTHTHTHKLFSASQISVKLEFKCRNPQTSQHRWPKALSLVAVTVWGPSPGRGLNIPVGRFLVFLPLVKHGWTFESRRISYRAGSKEIFNAARSCKSTQNPAVLPACAVTLSCTVVLHHWLVGHPALCCCCTPG